MLGGKYCLSGTVVAGMYLEWDYFEEWLTWYLIHTSHYNMMFVFTGELVKFKMFPKAESLHCLRVSLLAAHHLKTWTLLNGYQFLYIGGFHEI